MSLTLTLSDSFEIYREIIPIVIMKFVLAFLLLISIFYQIERGNCEPDEDSIINGMSNLATSSIDYIKDTFDKYYSYLPSMPEPMKDGYENMKDGMGEMMDGAKDVADKTLDDVID